MTQLFDARSEPASGSIQRAFPQDFLFGAATAAYQIEGAAHEDGRKDSVWDAFARVPGAVLDAHNGDVACDHYHRYEDDVELMASLGLQTYRFSTSWARIRPDDGPVNQKGLDFYSRLVDSLLAKNIKPWLTLYHWDHPQVLEEHGGWANRDTAFRFAEYALDVYNALGDRVQAWTTLNEPWCSSFLSYTGGAHAPGVQDPESGLAAGHHLMLGHGLVVRELQAADPTLQLGITLNLTVADPVDPSDAGDVDAARRIDGQFNRFFLDPIFRGEYPQDVMDDVAEFGFEKYLLDGDLGIISTPIGALGVNYYNGSAVSVHPDPVQHTSIVTPDRPTRSPFPAADGVHSHRRGLPRTAMDWEVQPEGLTRLLRRLKAEYTGSAVKLYITENGAAYEDVVEADGSIHDVDRTEFLRSHLNAILDAIDDGVDVYGYFYWSLMDNYEWTFGYHKRFGIVRVDYDTQERTLKDSALEYKRIIGDRAL